jgi:hypothetical protein
VETKDEPLPDRVLKSVRSEANDAGLLRVRLDSAYLNASRPGWRPAVAGLSVLSLAVLLAWWAQSAWPTGMSWWAPSRPKDRMIDLWQVHSAAVALAIPLLVLLIEQAKSERPLAATESEVISRQIRMPFLLVVSLGSIVALGLCALYVPSSKSLVVSFALSATVMSLIAFGYWRALRLVLLPAQLEDASELLFRDRAEKDVLDSYLEAVANDRVIRALEPWKAERGSGKSGDHLVTVDRPARITEIRLKRLHEALSNLTSLQQTQPAHRDEDGDPDTGVVDSGARRSIPQVRLALIGDVVGIDRPLVSLSSEASEDVKKAIRDCFETESVDDDTGRRSALRTTVQPLRDRVGDAILSVRPAAMTAGLALYGRLILQMLRSRESFASDPQKSLKASDLTLASGSEELLNDLWEFAKSTRALEHGPAWLIVDKMSLAMLETARSLRHEGFYYDHGRILELLAELHREAVRRKDESLATAVPRRLGAYVELALYQPAAAEKKDGADRCTRQAIDCLAECIRANITAQVAVAPAVAPLADLIAIGRFRRKGLRKEGDSDLADAVSEMVSRAAAMALGLQGFTLHLARRSAIPSEGARDSVDALRRAHGQANYLESAAVALSQRFDEFPWSRWEMSLWPPDQRGGALGQVEEAIRATAVAGLRPSSTSALLDEEDVVLPTQPEFFIRSLANALTALPSEIRQSVLGLSDGDEAAVVAAVNDAADELGRRERDRRSALPLDPDLITDFAEAVERAWSVPDILRRNPLDVQEQGAATSDLFGFNSLQPREFFLRLDDFVFAPPGDLGSSVGRGLVDGEHLEIAKLLSGLADSQQVPLQDLPKRVSETLDRLRRQGMRPSVAVFGSFSARRVLSELESQDENAEFATFITGDLCMCAVADFSRLLSIRRWRPVRAGPSAPLEIQVEDMTPDYARQLIASNPHLLTSNGVQLDEDAAIDRLRVNVHVRAWTRVRFDLIDPMAGSVFLLRA